MNRSPIAWGVRSLVMTVLIAVGAGCLLDRSGINVRLGLPPVTSNVEPTFICPGDPVTVTWDGGPVGECESVGTNARWGSGCEEMILRTAVAVSSAPNLFGGSPVPADETRGSRTVNPTEDTAITVEFTRANGDLNYSETVTVDVFDSDDLQPAAFGRVCTGVGGQWTLLEPLPGQTLPDRMRITEVCNNNPWPVAITVVDSGTPFRLEARECTGEIRPARQVRLDAPIDAAAAAALLADEDCRGGMTSGNVPGRPMPMQARLRCIAP